MSAMGWHYPAGAEGDPNAPYNQEEIGPCDCGHPYDDHEECGAGACLISDCDCTSFVEMEPEDEEEDRWGDD